jgi:hypothetical protein
VELILWVLLKREQISYLSTGAVVVVVVVVVVGGGGGLKFEEALLEE